MDELDKGKISAAAGKQDKLSKPLPNLNTTVGLYVKITLHTPPPHPHKLNVSNISAVTDPILMKF